jgi:hypothetical protein
MSVDMLSGQHVHGLPSPWTRTTYHKRADYVVRGHVVHTSIIYNFTAVFYAVI